MVTPVPKRGYNRNSKKKRPSCAIFNILGSILLPSKSLLEAFHNGIVL